MLGANVVMWEFSQSKFVYGQLRIYSGQSSLLVVRGQNALACRYNYSGTNNGLGGVDESSGAGAHDFGYISIQRWREERRSSLSPQR